MANVIIISDNETPAYEKTLKYGGIKSREVYDVAYRCMAVFRGRINENGDERVI